MVVKQVWAKWMVVAEKVGNFQFQVLFSLLYFLLWTPVGIVASRFYDFLSLKNRPVWNKIRKKLDSLEELQNQ